MGKSLLTVFYSNTTFGTGGKFFAPGCAAMGRWFLGYTATEAEQQIKAKLAGTLSDIEVRYGSIPGLIASAVLRKNGADTALVVNALESAETYPLKADNVNTVALAADDLFDFEYNTNKNGTAFYYVRALFESSGNHGCYYTQSIPSGRQPTRSTAGSTFYLAAVGNPEYSITAPVEAIGETVEANVQLRARVAGTVRGCQLYVKTNTRTTPTVFHLRINGANSAIEISVGAGATGRIEPSGSTNAAIAAGDYFNWSYENGGGSGAINLTLSSLLIEASSGHKNDIFAYTGRDSETEFTGASAFVNLCGALYLTAVESNVHIRHGFNGIASRLRCYLESNTCNGPIFVRFRKNGVTGNSVVEIPAGTAGFFEDTANTDAFDCDDFCNYLISGGGSSGTAVFKSIGLTEEDTLVPCGGVVSTGVISGEESEGGVIEPGWPVTFSPVATGIIPRYAVVSGGRSLSLAEDAAETQTGFWEIVLHGIPVRSKRDVLYFREIEAKLTGRISVAILHFCDGKRAPWPLVGDEIIATTPSGFVPGATTGSIQVTQGAALRAGMHFSPSIGERMYRLRVVGTPTGNVYPVTIWPRVREAVSSGASLDFHDLRLRSRLKDPDAMHTALENLRWADPTLPFVEDVLP